MKKIQTLVDQSKIDQKQQKTRLASMSSSEQHLQSHQSPVEARDIVFLKEASDLISAKFTLLYGALWSSKYNTENERRGLLFPYAENAKKMGGIKQCTYVLKWLSSTQNKEFTKYPPQPQEFLQLWYKIPKPMAKNQFKIQKDVTVTAKGRIYSGISKLCVGSSIDKSHADIKELVLYNYEKFQEHREKNGDPIPGVKGYNYYQVDLRGEA